MGLPALEPGSEQLAADEEENEKRRLPVFHLFGLAAGGVIGSGWLLNASKTYQAAGQFAPLAWIFGGVVMLLIGFVMVELGIAAPQTGGLIFLPLRSSGGLVATVAASGLWIFYAINTATEAVAMAKGLPASPGTLFHSTAADILTVKGWGFVLAFMVMISAVNLVAPWLFFHINSWLTVVKVIIPVLTVALLITSGFPGLLESGPSSQHHFTDALTAVVTGGVVYSYVGFQGPLDFSGNIRRRGIGEAARLRWAIFGTIIGSMVLYTALQFIYQRSSGSSDRPGAASPFPLIASAAKMPGLGTLLKIAAVLSPLGAGLVFTHALTREVAALSRAHLTHRRLQTARRGSLKRHYNVYWLVLLVNLVVGAVALRAVGGNRDTLVAITGVLAPIVYAFPGVVLVSLGNHLTGYSRRRRNAHKWLARASFALIALLLYGAGWHTLWIGMVTLATGCVVLLGLPLLSRLLPSFGPFYDANEYVTLFRHWRSSAPAKAGIWLIGYLVTLTLLTLIGNPQGRHSHHWVTASFGALAVATALLAFECLVRASRRHMAEEPPSLPTPARVG